MQIFFHCINNYIYYSVNYVYFIWQLTHRRDTVCLIEQPVLSLTTSFSFKSLNMPSTLTKVHGAQNSCSQLLSPQNHLNNCTSRMSYNSQPSSKGCCTESLNQEGNVSQQATYHCSTFSTKKSGFHGLNIRFTAMRYLENNGFNVSEFPNLFTDPQTTCFFQIT